ncbi:monovalent cation:proton antiporter family protein [Calderihabitans maritimus]|nr:cation:proton antiporter [Calderihabitans maritimus]
MQEVAFHPLLLVVVLAFAVPFVLEHLRIIRIPVVVGEILAGLVIGKSGLNVVTADPWLDFLATFGFTYLMFLSGLEVDLEGINLSRVNNKRPQIARLLTGALLYFVATLILSFLIALFLWQQKLIKNPWLLALIFSTTSLGIVVPVLKERGLIDTSLGQNILISAVLADFLTMFLTTVLVALATTGPTHEVLLILVLFVAFFLLYRTGLVLSRLPIMRNLAGATSEIQVRGALATMLFFISLAQELGSEIILGAFLAGVIISLLSRRGSSLRLKLDAIGYGFFIPIFFITVGSQLDLAVLVHSHTALILVPAFLVSAFLVKVIPALFFRSYSNLREKLAAGILLSSRLSLIIAVSTIGLRLGAISETTHAAVIIVAIVTSSLSPVLFSKLVDPGRPKQLKTLIIGASEAGLVLAQRLKNRHQHHVVVVDHDPVRLAKGKDMGLTLVNSDATTYQGLEKAGITEATAVVAATGDDAVNLRVAEIARRQYGIKNVIAFLNNLRNTQVAEDLGIKVVTPPLSTLIVAENILVHPETFSLLRDEPEDTTFEEVRLRNHRFFEQRLKYINLPGDVLVVSIIRGQDRIVPRGNTLLKKDDLLILMGNRDSIKEASRQLGAV